MQSKHHREVGTWGKIPSGWEEAAYKSFRCVLLASITVLGTVPIAMLLDPYGIRLIQVGSMFAAILTVPTFILSLALFKSKPRLAFKGLVALALLGLYGFCVPTHLIS